LLIAGVAGAIFVEEAVAIVVEAVSAYFIGWFDLSLAWPPDAVGAGLDPLPAFADVGAAGLGEVFVYFSIAIVVFAVADFFLWFHRTDAVAKDAVFTNPVTGLTFTHIGAAGDGDVFVHLSIAVVVDSVTDLRRGTDFAFTRSEHAILAGLNALLACADVRTAFARLAGEAGATLIDGAIAVIVEPVADFGGGTDFAYAGTPLTHVTGLDARDTDADVGTAGAGEVLVDFAVTIVVDAVANFFLRFDGACAWSPRALITILDALLAGADVGTTNARQIFVNLPIAIVIEAVAYFGSGP